MPEHELPIHSGHIEFSRMCSVLQSCLGLYNHWYYFIAKTSKLWRAPSWRHFWWYLTSCPFCWGWYVTRDEVIPARYFSFIMIPCSVHNCGTEDCAVADEKKSGAVRKSGRQARSRFQMWSIEKLRQGSCRQCMPISFTIGLVTLQKHYFKAF
jgi:hypothetical protein